MHNVLVIKYYGFWGPKKGAVWEVGAANPGTSFVIGLGIPFESIFSEHPVST